MSGERWHNQALPSNLTSIKKWLKHFCTMRDLYLDKLHHCHGNHHCMRRKNCLRGFGRLRWHDNYANAANIRLCLKIKEMRTKKFIKGVRLPPANLFVHDTSTWKWGPSSGIHPTFLKRPILCDAKLGLFYSHWFLKKKSTKTKEHF